LDSGSRWVSLGIGLDIPRFDVRAGWLVLRWPGFPGEWQGVEGWGAGNVFVLGIVVVVVVFWCVRGWSLGVW